MIAGFAETYHLKSNTELILLAKEREHLQEDARQALETELQRRGLRSDSALDMSTADVQDLAGNTANGDAEQPYPFQKRTMIVFWVVSCPVFLAALYHRIPPRGALFAAMAAGLLVAGIWLVMVEDILSPKKR